MLPFPFAAAAAITCETEVHGETRETHSRRGRGNARDREMNQGYMRGRKIDKMDEDNGNARKRVPKSFISLSVREEMALQHRSKQTKVKGVVFARKKEREHARERAREGKERARGIDSERERENAREIERVVDDAR